MCDCSIVDVSVVVAAYVADVSSLFLKITLILFVLLIFLSLLLVVAVVVVLMYISIHFLIFLDPCSPESDWPCAPPVLPYTDYGNGKLRPESEFAFTSHIFLLDKRKTDLCRKTLFDIKLEDWQDHLARLNVIVVPLAAHRRWWLLVFRLWG